MASEAYLWHQVGEIYSRVRKKLGAKVHHTQLSARFQLVGAGDPLDRIFSLESGKIKLMRETYLGRDNLLEILGEGDVLGLQSLVGENTWFATASTLEPVEIDWVRVEDVRKFLASNPNQEVQLLRSFGALTRKHYERAAALRDIDIPGRIASAILILMQRFGEEGEGGVTLPKGLTQLELAQMAGASRETANKVLADFVGRGWIVMNKRVIVVIEPERLERRAS